MVRVLFLIENGSYRYDHRARREVCTLRDAGAHVTVICPAYTDENLRETMDESVEIYRYRYPELGKGFVSHLGEYASSMAAMSALMAWVWRKQGFDVIHAVNPPDLLWMLVAPYKAIGKKFVFDHYDLNPELFQDRFGDSSAMKMLPLVRVMEKASIRTADHVISTNDSYRQIAIERCGKSPELVTVVRNGPDTERFSATDPDPRVGKLGRVVIGYLGNMNPQDGLDHFVEMARILKQDRKRDDIGYVLVGRGDSYDDILRLRDEYGLHDCMMLPGRLPAAEVMTVLSGADLCVQPDPYNRLNNVSTMNKVMEYMSLGKPVVAYDLKETMVSGGDVCQYVPHAAGPAGLADKVIELADDEKRRTELGKAGRERVENVLAWPHQAPNLIRVYDSIFPGMLALPAVAAR